MRKGQFMAARLASLHFFVPFVTFCSRLFRLRFRSVPVNRFQAHCMPDFATIIVVHPRERRAKCTVQALRKRPGFQFYKHPRVPNKLPGYVRLGFGGPILGPADADSGLLVLDGTWRWVEPMERLVASVPIRSLPPLKTAYPRSSKVSDDPDGGLATIEAIYAAYRLLGRDTTSLLDHYHWGEQFIAQNAEFWPAEMRPDPKNCDEF
jgi:pre-rRNA-processing protein TSR3